MSSIVKQIRGLYGFRYQNKDYLSLNQVDSMFEGLGEHIYSFVQWLLTNEENESSQSKLDTMLKNIQEIKFVPVMKSISDEEKAYLKDFHQKYGLSDKMNLMLTDWAGFFSNEEGNIDMYYDGFKYMIDFSYMMLLSSQIKYAYIINFDSNCLEVYVGDNQCKIENSENRYSHLKNDFIGDGYYGVVLQRSILFNDICNSPNKKLVDWMTVR